MKKNNQNLLLNVELEVTPLTQDAEGKLLGGFVGMQGSANVDAAANNGCENNNCNNSSCVNDQCINPADCSNSGTNDHCTNGTTTEPPSTTDTTTAIFTPELHFF